MKFKPTKATISAFSRDLETFSEYLTVYQNAVMKSNIELAALLGVSRQTWYRWKNLGPGFTGFVDGSHLPALIELLGMRSIVDLFVREADGSLSGDFLIRMAEKHKEMMSLQVQNFLKRLK